ncbi:uncharacterized protein C20orf204 homolog [Thomomys bottae]
MASHGGSPLSSAAGSPDTRAGPSVGTVILGKGCMDLPLQVSPKAALCVLLLLPLVLLRTTRGRAGPASCSLPDMMHHYRTIIFQDLQAALQLRFPALRAPRPRPGSRHHPPGQRGLRPPPGAACGAQKGLFSGPRTCASPPQERAVLRSMQALVGTLRGAAAGGRQGALEKAAWTVAVRTEAAMRRHCWASLQRRRRPAPAPARSWRGHRHWRRRRLLVRALGAVATCWNQLFALGAAGPGRPGPHDRAHLPRPARRGPLPGGP